MTRIVGRLALLLAVLVGPAFLYGCSSEEAPAPAPAAGGAPTSPAGSAPNAPGAPAAPAKDAAK